jgi:site-specific DNA-methyltransferase (adenine-specific)
MSSYTRNRQKVFNKIIQLSEENCEYSSKETLLIKDDSLNALKKIPDNSISLILTDPPYHSTKKKNITNDTAFKNDKEFIDWMKLYSDEWKRVLKPNGGIYVFCSSKMSARLEVMFSENFNVLSHIVWSKPNEPGFDGWKGKMKKESLRQWYAHSERILFLESSSKTNLKKSTFGQFLREKRDLCGMSGHELTEITGAYGKVNHGGAVSNWETGRNIPSREQYQKICSAFMSTGKIKSMPYYEDVIRPFNVSASVEFTDVWDFYSVRPYKGKHPAEKPQDLLEHCILSSTFKKDIILDCFAGSGSTAIAALKNDRLSISIELEEKWVKSIKSRLTKLNTESDLANLNGSQIMKLTGDKGINKKTVKSKEPTLFTI